jgi:hypothetical protein
MCCAGDDGGDASASPSNRLIRVPDVEDLLGVERDRDRNHRSVSDLFAGEGGGIVGIDEDDDLAWPQRVGELEAAVDDAHEVLGHGLGDSTGGTEVGLDGLPNDRVQGLLSEPRVGVCRAALGRWDEVVPDLGVELVAPAQTLEMGLAVIASGQVVINVDVSVVGWAGQSGERAGTLT